MTVCEANRLRLCLVCGAPDANLLRLPDGRNVRACDDCLNSGDNTWISYEMREPLPCELSPPPYRSKRKREDHNER